LSITWTSLGEALLWCVIGGVACWLLLTPIRRRSLSGLLASLVLTGAAASAGALLGAMHAMLVSWGDWQSLTVVIALSGAVTAAAAVAVGRRLVRDNRSLQQAVAELGAGRVPAADGPRLTAEVERVRTELRATAAALAETREREHALEAARRELVAWVSHDLRTPLAGLRAMTEALEDGIVADPWRYHAQIRAEVERLSGMVGDLFELSRIQAGVLALATSRMSVYDLVGDAIAGVDPLAREHGVRLEGTGVEAVPVEVDGREMTRVLANLLVNAIHRTPADGTVAIAAHREADSVVLSVTDGCGGIPAEDLPRVFDTGWRGTQSRTPPAGAGLGLAIVRGIVEAHAGHAAVRNVPGGCRFEVVLPAAG
jgi:signal transduction histidine kinase